MAGKTQKALVTKVIRGPVREGWESWSRGRFRRTLQQPATVCKEKISGSLLLAVVHGRMMEDSWPQLTYRRFRLDIRKNFFPWGESRSTSGCTERLYGLYP